MKSTSRCACTGCFAPRSTPTNSTCRKHDDSTAAMPGAVFGGSAYTTSAGGLDAYDTTIGRLPPPPPAVKSPLYACSHPSSTSTSLARNRSQYWCQPVVPYFSIVARRKPSPGDDCAGSSTTVSPL